jgi:hypothetical protein
LPIDERFFGSPAKNKIRSRLGKGWGTRPFRTLWFLKFVCNTHSVETETGITQKDGRPALVVCLGYAASKLRGLQAFDRANLPSEITTILRLKGSTLHPLPEKGKADENH